VSKKKPLCTVPKAHSKPVGSLEETIPDESWITSIATLCSTDLLASGNGSTFSLSDVQSVKRQSDSHLVTSQSIISQSVSQLDVSQSVSFLPG